MKLQQSIRSLAPIIFSVSLLTLTACDNGSAVPPTPAAALTAITENFAVTVAPVKTFAFSWDNNASASYFKLMENPDGISGFTQVGANIPAGSTTLDLVVPLHKRVNAKYIIASCSVNDVCTDSVEVAIAGTLVNAIGYIKASNTGNGDRFGRYLSFSGDGNTLAISATNEDSNSVGIGGDQTLNGDTNSGAVYLFTRSGATWVQEEYIKASNTDASDGFGRSLSLSLSDDGNTLAVGASGEDSSAIGINGDESLNTLLSAGAVYVFTRSAGTWTQQAYVKASNTGAGDGFGGSQLSLSADGDTLAVGADREDSNATGEGGNQLNNSAGNSGAVYVFTRSGGLWSQHAYIKASNTDAGDFFGETLSLSSDGNTLAVGANAESRVSSIPKCNT